jgi:anti-sigma B factor antagonist
VADARPLPLPPGFTCTAARYDETTAIVSLAGEFDLSTVGRAESVFDALASTPRLVVDLSDVYFLDSTALHLLFDCMRGARDEGGEVVLAGPPPFVARVLKLSGISALARVEPSLADALAPATQPDGR